MGGRYPVVEEASNVVQLPGTEEKNIDISDDDAKKQAKEFRPRGLSTAERKVWDRVVPEFVKAGRFKPLYQDFIKNYCVVVARMDKFLEDLDENGWKYTTHGRNGVQHRPRPEAAQYNDDWRKWNTLVNQLGMSPATDQRFHNIQPDMFNDPY